MPTGWQKTIIGNHYDDNVSRKHREGLATGTQAAELAKRSGRNWSNHLCIAEQHGFKVFRIAADIHLLEIIVPTRGCDLPLEFALKLGVGHPIDAKEIVRSTTIGLGRVHAIGNDVDTGGLQTFDRFDHFLREIGPLTFRAFGPGGTVVIEFDKDLLHDAPNFLKNCDLIPLDPVVPTPDRTRAFP